MTFEEIKRRWFDSKAGILEEESLELIKGDHQYYFYVCPCGGDDHYAMRPIITEGCSCHPGDVLTCFFTDQQWLVRPVDVAKVIKGEEERYLALLERAPDIVRKVVAKRGWSDQTAAFLLDTHGIDKDLAIEIVTEMERGHGEERQEAETQEDQEEVGT